MGKTLILGIGNLLLRDEGVGIHTVTEMMKMDLPEDVEVVDGATAGFDILSLADSVDRLIIVDALKGGGTPGTIYRLPPEDIARYEHSSLSLHQVDLMQMLDMCALIGTKPSTVIVGVEPESIDFSMELSSSVKARIPEIIEVILEEINHS